MAVKFNPFSGSFDLVGDLAISQVLTGYTSGAGTVAATDTILQAIQKLNGNDAFMLPLAGGTITGNIIPNANNTLDLGSATGPAFFANVYSTAYTGSTLSILDTGSTYRLAIDSPSTTVLRLGGAAAWATTRIGSSTVAIGNSVCVLTTQNTGVNMTIQTSAGGALLLTSGTYAGATSTGGAVKLFSGNATNTGGNSGHVLIYNGTSASGTRGSIAIGNFTPTVGYDLELRTNALAEVGFVIRGFGAAGSYTQTGDLQKWQSYDGTTAIDLIRIDSSGALAGNNTTGTNATGGNLSLKAGAGTGAGAISQIVFQTPTLGTSGSTAQSLATRATLDSSGLTLAVNLAMGSKDITNAANITMGGTLTLGSASTIQSNTTATNTLTIKTANAGTSGALTLTTGDTSGTSGYVRIGVGTGTAGKGAVIIGSNSLSAVYRSTNAGSDITPQILIDPASSLTSGNAYSFNTAQGFGFTRANGTRRILRWSALLSSNIDTAGAESSDLTWTPLNVLDKFIIGGALNLNQYTGTGTAAAEIDSNGNVIRGDAIESMTISDATIISQLTTGGNWTGTPKAYTGSAISGAVQGQFYDDGTYFYIFVDNVTPKRLAYA
jgi:hypothetical protein